MNPKKILIYLVQLLVNGGLIYAAWWLYKNMALPYSYYTALPQYFNEIFLTTALLILLPLLSLKKLAPVNLFSFGLSAILAVGSYAGVIYLNQTLSPGKYQRRFPVERVEKKYDYLEMEVYIYEKSSRVNFICPYSDCQRTDTVKVTILKGALGFPVVSSKIDESKKPGC